ncbi:MAG TPA: hypothetical protein DDY76_04725 [Opitutae bacterium]|nr:hypothetical protein [Opitutae bacterium]
MKNPKITLVIANVILGFIIYLNLEKDDDELRDLNTELVYAVSNLNKIEIVNSLRQEKLVLSKDAQSWNIIEPISWPVDRLVFSNFSAKIAHLKCERLHDVQKLESRGEILSDYGIEENSTRLLLHSNGEIIEITIGKPTRDSDSVYSLIRKSNEANRAIWKISNDINQVARSSTSTWAVPTFINMPLYAIDELVLTFRTDANQSRQTHIRKKDDKWSFVHPFSADANKEKVLFTLNQLVSQKVSSFMAPADDIDRNESWNIKLTIIGLGESKDYFFQSNEDTPTLRARTDFLGTVTPFQIDESFKQTLSQWATKLRETQIFNLNPSEIQAIKISSGTQSVELNKQTKDNWSVSESNSTQSMESEADFESIAELMRNLNTVEIKNFLSFNPSEEEMEQYGISFPKYEIQVTNSDTSQQTILICDSVDQSSLWKTFLSDQSLICTVEYPWSEILSRKGLHYRKKLLVTNFPDYTLANLTQIDGNDTQSLTLSESNQTFEVIRRFTASEFIQDRFNNEGAWVSGDWVPWKYKLTFESQNNEEKVEFHLSERTGATSWYGGSELLGLTFNLQIQVIDEMSKLIEYLDLK